jgi:hypothetical protein
VYPDCFGASPCREWVRRALARHPFVSATRQAEIS